MSNYFWIIIAGAIVTYITRIGGHLVLSRFPHIHYRVEAALNAVPAAVLTTLFAPAAFEAGWQEQLTLLFCVLISFRIGILPMFIAGSALLIGLRYWIPT